MKNKGVQFILLSAFFFAVMNLFVKLSGDLPSVQKKAFSAIWWRPALQR